MAVLILDTFTRTVANSWGTAETGGVYTDSTAGLKGVSGGLGTMAMTGATPGRPTQMLSIVATDAISVAIFSTDVNAAGGDNTLRLLLRANGTTQYSAEFSWRPTANGRIRLLKTVPAVPPATGNVTTTLATFVRASVALGGIRFSVKCEVLGVNPTTLRAKVWATDTEIEPAAWSSTVVDSEVALQASGNLGFDFGVAGTSTAGTVTFRVDNWQVDGAASGTTALNGSTAGTGTATGVLTTGSPLIGTSAGTSSATAVLGSSGPAVLLRDTFTRTVIEPVTPGGQFGVAAVPAIDTYYNTTAGNRQVVYDGAVVTQTLDCDGTKTVAGQQVQWSNPAIQKIVKNTTFQDINSGSGINLGQVQNVLFYGCTLQRIRRGSPNPPFAGHAFNAKGGTAAVPTDLITIAGCTFGEIGVDNIQIGGSGTSGTTEGRFTARLNFEYNDCIGPGDVAVALYYGENAVDVKGCIGPVVLRGNIFRGWRPCLTGQDCSGSNGVAVTIHFGAGSGMPGQVTLIENWFDDNGVGTGPSAGGTPAALNVAEANGVDVQAGNKFQKSTNHHIFVHSGPQGPTANVRVARNALIIINPGTIQYDVPVTEY